MKYQVKLQFSIEQIIYNFFVNKGNLDQYLSGVEQIQMLNPAETLTHTEQSYPMLDRAMKERFLDDLRKAGLPE